jgi:iron complex outermembrane recepter protein
MQRASAARGFAPYLSGYESIYTLSGDFIVVLKRNLLSLALASAFIGVFPSAYAQTDKTDAEDAAADAAAAEPVAEAMEEDAKDLDAVVVTGIRGAIETSINVKREQTSIVEVISAEDIGKLPDTSIAESIARLPGLTAQRVAGRSSSVSIRGLAGDFSTTLLNGREQVSSGDNRGVEFDQYPSELLSGVTVYKTPDANLVAQGISGTVNLRTIRPLESKGRTMAVNVRGEKNSEGELNPGYSDTGNRFSFSFVDKFMDDTLGVAFGFARLDSPGQANRWKTWGYVNVGTPTAPVAGLGGSESFATSTDNVRNGAIAVVEFAPNDFYNGSLDLYYSKFDRDETTRGLQTGLGFSGATYSNVQRQGFIATSALATGVYGPVIRNDLNTRTDDIFALGFKNQFAFENWKATADLSLSRANRDERILETYAGITNPVKDNVLIGIDPRTGLANLTFGRDYTNPATVQLTDPGGWGQNGYVKYPKFKDELRSLMISGERSFTEGAFPSLELGVNFSKRTKSRNVAESFLDLVNGPRTAIPAGILQGPANLSFSGIPGVISYDVHNVIGSLYRTRTNINPDITNKDWEVSEKVAMGFVKLNIDTTMGDMPVRGNVGFQYVRADQKSDGFAVYGGNAAASKPFSGGAKYGNFLPSLNLGFEVMDETFLRIGVARVLARPRMDTMRANSNVSVDTGRARYSGDGGNPNLRPWLANSYDLSFERYFGNKGYISAAAFHKDLKSYIYQQTLPFDFAGYDLTSFVGATRPTSTVGVFTSNVNGTGGGINGTELAFSTPFDWLDESLEGFGLQGSYSDTRSSVRPPADDSRFPLPGLSRYVSNITAFYEMSGFSVRISQRTRSSFLGEVQGFGADREFKLIAGEKLVDFQTGYEFQQGSLQGLSVLLQINNLKNEPYREITRFDISSIGRIDLPREYNAYGRTVLLGVNYKF